MPSQPVRLYQGEIVLWTVWYYVLVKNANVHMPTRACGAVYYGAKNRHGRAQSSGAV